MNQPDPYNLSRFLAAQTRDYNTALTELRSGRKRSHWIWYIFPQIAGLGHSSMAQEYAIRSREEAEAYLQHPVLGPRLLDCAEALLSHAGKRIEDIMGYPDDLKLNSSMTLFGELAPAGSVFEKVLSDFYGGQRDARTLSFLQDKPAG